MRKHERELVDFLRTTYGAEQFRLEGGGKHSKLRFHCNGNQFSYIVGSAGDHRAVKNIHAELRRMLEQEPLPQPPPELEELMTKTTTPFNPVPINKDGIPVVDYAENIERVADEKPHALILEHPETAPTAPTGRTWNIRVCAYGGSGKPAVWFLFNKRNIAEIQRSYPHGMKIERMDDENWKLSPGGTHKFMKYDGHLRMSYSDGGVEPFGSSPAEAVEVNGEILIFLAMKNRKKITLYQPQKSAPKIPLKAEEPRASHPPPPEVQPVPPGVQPVKVVIQQPMLMTTSSVMEERMLDIIRQIYDIEMLCPYRIVRLENGRLSWRAPDIG